MGSRGRTSGAEIEAGQALVFERPIAPKDLTEAQAEVWLSVVNHMPAEWFGPEQHPVLAAYCRAVVRHQMISAELNEFDPTWLKDQEGLQRYDRLAKIEDLHIKQVASLATKLRLTQQSRYTPQAAATAAKRGRSMRPWERAALPGTSAG